MKRLMVSTIGLTTVGLTTVGLTTVGLTTVGLSLIAAPAQAQFVIIESTPGIQNSPDFGVQIDHTQGFSSPSFHAPVTINHGSIANSPNDMYMPSHSNIYTPQREIMRIHQPQHRVYHQPQHRVYHQPQHRVYRVPAVYYQRTEIISPDGNQRIILEDPVYAPGYYNTPPQPYHQRHHRYQRHPQRSRINIRF
jgi:hypothetical protein